MPANLANLDKVLKLHYLGPIRKQFIEGNVLLKRLQKNSESVTGKNFTVPLHVGRNVGIGARPESGNLPVAGNQQYRETIIPMKYNYGKISVTGQAIKATRNDAGAFVRAVDSEIRGLVSDFKRDINRQLHGDGTGKLATCGTTTTSTTVNVDDTRFLQVGMLIDVILASNGTLVTAGTGVTINSIPNSTSIVISGSAISTTSANIIVRHESVSGTTCYELNGLGNIVSDAGVCQGITRSSDTWWKATVNTNASNRALTLDLMQQCVDSAEKNGGKPSIILTDHTRRNSYLNLLQASRRFVNVMELDGGFKALEYNGIPLVVDIDIVPNTFLFLDEPTLQIYQMSEIDWMDEDGAILCRTNQDAYEATLYWYSELATSCANKNVRLEKIS